MVRRSIAQSPIPGPRAASISSHSMMPAKCKNACIRSHDSAPRGAAATGRGDREPDRPRSRCELARLNGRQEPRADFWPILGVPGPAACLRQRGPCGKNRRACRDLLGSVLLNSRACCRSSVVEHSIGNGEVDSSILSGSTIRLAARQQVASVIAGGPRRRAERQGDRPEFECGGYGENRSDHESMEQGQPLHSSRASPNGHSVVKGRALSS